MTYASGFGQTNINLSGSDSIFESVKNFGAVGNGIADDTSEIQAAFDAVGRAGGGTVFFPTGTYRITSQINIPTVCNILGEGESSVLDFSTGTISSYPEGCIVGSGSLTPIPTIAANIVQYDTGTTLTSASSILAENDVIILENTTDFSFNVARAYYHAGEFYRLVSVSGATLTFDEPSFSGYTAGANISLWKLNPSIINIEKIKVIGPGETTPVSNVIVLRLGRSITIKDIYASGANQALITIDRCYETYISGVRGYDFSTAGGYNYGISIGNSQKIIVSDCQITTRRHAITLGGGSNDGAVPCRQGIIAQSALGSLEIFGIGLHGNCEWIEISDCEVPGGVVISGNHTKLYDCTVWSEPINGIAIIFSEINGPNHWIIDNEIIAVTNCIASPASLVIWDDVIAANSMPNSGTFRIIDNSFVMGSFTGSPGQFQNRTNQQNVDFEFINNTISQNVAVAASSTSTFQVRGDAVNNYIWRSVRFIGNESSGPALSAYQTGSREIIMQDNSVYGAGTEGIRALVNGVVNPWPSEDIVVQNNYVDFSQAEGIVIAGNPGITNVKCTGNVSVRNGQGGFAPPGDRSSVTIVDCNILDLSGNTFGDNQGVPTQTRLWSLSNISLLCLFNNQNIGTVTAVDEAAITKKIAYVYSQTNQSVSFATAPPAAGAWLQGDICWNTAPAAGGTPGWVCVTSGTPGTWKAMANVAV